MPDEKKNGKNESLSGRWRSKIQQKYYAKLHYIFLKTSDHHRNPYSVHLSFRFWIGRVVSYLFIEIYSWLKSSSDFPAFILIVDLVDEANAFS